MGNHNIWCQYCGGDERGQQPACSCCNDNKCGKCSKCIILKSDFVYHLRSALDVAARATVVVTEQRDVAYLKIKNVAEAVTPWMIENAVHGTFATDCVKLIVAELDAKEKALDSIVHEFIDVYPHADGRTWLVRLRFNHAWVLRQDGTWKRYAPDEPCDAGQWRTEAEARAAISGINLRLAAIDGGLLNPMCPKCRCYHDPRISGCVLSEAERKRL